jgi:hypothetical protein
MPVCSGADRHARVMCPRPCRRKDVVRVPVKVFAGSVISHRGAGIGVAGGDLDVPQIDPGVEHGGDEDVAQHVRMHPRRPHHRHLGQATQPPSGAVPSIRTPRRFSKIGPLVRSAVARSSTRPTAGGRGTSTIFEPLPCTRRTRWPCSSPTSLMSAAQASKIRRPNKPSIVTSAKSTTLGDSRAAVRNASNCRLRQPESG